MLGTLLAACFLLQSPPPDGQAKLLGAQEAIRELTANDSAVAIARAELAYLDRVNGYIKRSPFMPIEEAAHSWLELVDAGPAVPRRPLRMGGNPGPIGSLRTAIAALPRPEVWPAIVEAISSRPPTKPNKSLLLLFARLRGDEKEVLKLARELSPPVKRETQTSSGQYSPSLGNVVSAARSRSHDLASAIQAIEKNIGNPESGEGNSLPDVASLLSPQQAKDVLLRLFRRAKQSFYIAGPASRELARQVVLANLKQIPTPQWALADSMRDAGYVRKLVARYGAKSLASREGDTSEAQNIHLGDLLMRGELAQAAGFLRRLEGSPSFSFTYNSQGSIRVDGSLFAPIAELQKRVPERDLWQQYAEAATASGNGAAAAKRLQLLVRDPKIKSALKESLVGILLDLLASRGDTQALIATLRDSIRTPSPRSEWDATRLLELGVALNDPALVREGVAGRLKGSNPAREIELLESLISQKRLGEAERVIGDALKKKSGTSELAYNGNVYGFRLCRLYFAAERPEDIVTVFRDFPYWSGTELGKIANTSVYGSEWEGDNPYPPLGFYAAWAFAKTGRSDLAQRVLRNTLLDVVASDNAYGLLNELGGVETLKLYEELAAVHPLEPRPRIWKAALLLKLGRLDEAETSAREAIKIDPSDGKSNPAQRFKVYEVLASILGKKRDAKGAAACTTRVRAARLAEKAERFAEVGLLPQAVSLFKESIRVAPADYVVEERLAQCQDAIGERAAATYHHKRAYGLLAQGFGPGTKLASTCEHLFQDPDLLDIGAPILAALASKTGTSAPAAFILGRFQDESGKPKQAVASYQRAVKLDPSFLPAWQELGRLGADGFLSQTQTEAAEFEVLALNPMSDEISWTTFESIRDLGAAYRKIVQIREGLPKPSNEPIFPLHSAMARERQVMASQWSWGRSNLDVPPGGLFLQARDVLAIVDAYDGFVEFLGGER